MNPVAEVIPAATPAATSELPLEEETYPDSLGTNPFDIIKFIRDHPRGKLQNLWKRLGLRPDTPDSDVYFNDSCGYCETSSFEYNLDDDAEREVVLQIKDEVARSYRYLVFRDCWSGKSEFLGNIDVWAKYPPADPVVLISGGRAWLIVQSTAATGTGLGAWLDSVYQVSNGRVKRVATYLARVNQSGFYPLPSKVFVGNPVSCEIKHGNVILTVSYRVQYSDYSNDKVPLFTRQQTAVLRGSLKNGAPVLDVGTSEVAPGEFESIYNFDSMGPDQFVKYNYPELRAIANSDNSERKKWLKEFLDTCRNTRMKRELSALLK